MKSYSNLIIICLLVASGSIHSQQYKVANANVKYNNMSYVEAINLYTSLVHDGYGSSEIFENLGNSYYLQSNYALAKASYDSLFQKTEDVSLATYYRYINVLRSEKKDAQAADLYSKLLAKFPKENRISNAKNSLFLHPEVLPTAFVALKNAKVNSPYSDYKASYLGDDKVVFSSSRETKKITSIKSIWNNEAYTNLYESTLVSDSLKGNVEKLKGSVNKFYNESSAVFTKDGTTMYFTRNNQLSAKVETDSLDNVLLKIYKATYNGKRWDHVEELPFNSNQYNCAHPALSPNEDYLYFSSDMPGTKGDSDVFRVSINDANYGAPENLGSTINTAGRDTFPFVNSDNVLIFSSDFRKGLGGLDLYYVDLKSTSQKVYTFSQPINSAYDDFGLVYKVSEGTGFLTSNRKENNLGSDDIYEFSGFSIPQLEDLTVFIKSKNGTDVVGITEVILSNENGSILGVLPAINNQVLLLDVDPSKSYDLEVKNENYQPYTSAIKFEGTNSKTVYLKEKAPALVSVDLKDVLQLESIYFDFEKYEIRKDAAIELEKIVALLNNYPEIKIDIVGHTDSRGPAAYNEKLSAQRAASTKQWLVDKGISAERLNSFGFGERKPVNDCMAKKCTKQEFDQNRRTEFLIRQ